MPMFFVCLVLLVAFVGGFLESEETTERNLANIAKLLPKGFAMSTPLELKNRKGPKIEDKLIELGAKIVDGKIVDREGSEIVFIRQIIPSDPSPRLQKEYERTRKEIERLRRTKTLIVIVEVRV
jgi:hypothetical protein